METCLPIFKTKNNYKKIKMKKILLISSILIALCAVTFNANAQSLTRLKQGTASDTIHKSITKYTSSVNLNFNDLQAVTVGVAADSVSGSPALTFILQHSADNTHWLSGTGDTTTVTVTGGVGYVYKQINVNPFYGAYARVKYYASSATQNSKVSVTLKSSTIR